MMALAHYLSLISLLLCSVLMGRVLDLRAAPAASGQVPIEALQVPELDAGFHLLYELKPEQARNQFEAWQNSHPEDPKTRMKKRPFQEYTGL
jgi:hypothetical protein